MAINDLTDSPLKEGLWASNRHDQRAVLIARRRHIESASNKGKTLLDAGTRALHGYGAENYWQKISKKRQQA